jgi:hypothetical protein
MKIDNHLNKMLDDLHNRFHQQHQNMKDKLLFD